MIANDPPPLQPPQAQVEPSSEQLQQMNQSASENASPVQGGIVPCEKKSWFAIRVVDDKDKAVVEALTIHLKLTGIGETSRITSKATDPIKIEQLQPGGKGDVKQIETEDVVWEAVGDITSV